MNTPTAHCAVTFPDAQSPVYVNNVDLRGNWSRWEGPDLPVEMHADDADAIISSTMPDEVLGMCINHGGV
jgi:hypothetical protein